ncbi:MAG: serine/threonine protein kinase [Myxococcales bacterium]|nr:MAG: serine/threonine protein kinase [Myxococcales bacterium]
MSVEPLRAPSDPGDLPELPKAGDLVHGRYRVEFELGRGGMGVVLQAHDQMLDRNVALKVVLPRMLRSPEAIERFGNEARSLAQLESRHVVRVLDFGAIASPPSSAGLPFMVLELLRGEDLFTIAAREEGLSPARVVRYALQACAGLAAAHAQSIIHRDLKPENLFLAVEADGSECLKVLDFGIARSHSRRALTRGHVGVGSPGYMSPEQVEGTGHVDARSDIWGLGVVMYELLAHRPAFFGDNPQSLCLQILTAEVTPLLEIKPSLPPALVYIVERCMAREPDRRFANVAELAEALAPLDTWSPETDAERIRRHLDANESPVSETRPQKSRRIPSMDVVVTPVPAPRRNRRRIASFVLAGAVLLPVIALLPRVAQAPELAPARAWSARALEESQAAYFKVRDRARELWMKEPGGEPPPGHP